MTREEAIKKCHGIKYPEAHVQSLEALGLIKFDEAPKTLYTIDTTEIGAISIQKWPEGYVVWVGGKIRYKSWENN